MKGSTGRGGSCACANEAAAARHTSKHGRNILNTTLLRTRKNKIKLLGRLHAGPRLYGVLPRCAQTPMWVPVVRKRRRARNIDVIDVNNIQEPRSLIDNAKT